MIASRARRPLLAEVKYRSNLFKNWATLKPEFRAGRKPSREQGLDFAILTDREIYTRQEERNIGPRLRLFTEVFGLWVARTEGAKFWLQVVTELKNRGVADIFIACVDGLKGFPEAIEMVFPQA